MARREPTGRQRRRAELTDAIRVVFEVSGKIYGSLRIGLELRANGWQVSDDTIAEIMAERLGGTAGNLSGFLCTVTRRRDPHRGMR